MRILREPAITERRVEDEQAALQKAWWSAIGDMEGGVGFEPERWSTAAAPRHQDYTVLFRYLDETRDFYVMLHQFAPTEEMPVQGLHLDRSSVLQLVGGCDTQVELKAMHSGERTPFCAESHLLTVGSKPVYLPYPPDDLQYVARATGGKAMITSVVRSGRTQLQPSSEDGLRNFVTLKDRQRKLDILKDFEFMHQPIAY